MSRSAAVNILLTVIVLLAGFLLWSILYEATVIARFRPHMVGEGTIRWGLYRQQLSDKSLSSLLIPAKHFLARITYPDTQWETAMRGAIAASMTLAVGAGMITLTVASRKPMPYGAARFGTLTDAERHRLAGKEGLILGNLGNTTLRSDDPAHVLVVGPTRSGKGVSFVIPNGYMWQGSSVWFDPKRENYKAFAARRQALGDKVFLFSPGQRESHRYNPLDYIRRDDRMPTDCLVVASFIVPDDGKEIWGRSGRLLLATMIGYVVAAPSQEGKRHMRSVADLTTTQVDFNVLLKFIVKRQGKQLPQWVVDGFNQFIALEPETRNSALFNVTTALNPWNSDLIAAATAATDFDIGAFRRERMALFIGASVAELEAYRPLVKLLIQQIHDELMSELPQENEPYQVLMMIDEFRQLGRMDDLMAKLTVNAGYGFRMCLILQDLGQLDELYGKATRITTVSACQVKLFIRINDMETSEYVSDMLGNTTQEIHTPIIRGSQRTFQRRDKNVQLIERPLRSPQELREMPESIAILLVPNSPGFQLRKIRHYADRPYKKIFDEMAFQSIQAPELPKFERFDEVIAPDADAPPDKPRPINDSPAGPPPYMRDAPVRPVARRIAPSRTPTGAPLSDADEISVSALLKSSKEQSRAGMAKLLQESRKAIKDQAARAALDDLEAIAGKFDVD